MGNPDRGGAMERKDLQERGDQAVEDMRAHVEDLEQRRDAVEQRSEEARRETERLEEASPGTKALGDEDEDKDDEKAKAKAKHEDGDGDEDAAEEASTKDG